MCVMYCDHFHLQLPLHLSPYILPHPTLMLGGYGVLHLPVNAPLKSSDSTSLSSHQLGIAP